MAAFVAEIPGLEFVDGIAGGSVRMAQAPAPLVYDDVASDGAARATGREELESAGWGPVTYPRAPDAAKGEFLRVVTVPAITIGQVVGR